MPRFRTRSHAAPPTPLDVQAIIAEAMRPAHFFEGTAIRLEWETTGQEDVSWEIFQGRLLDPAHTRCRQFFEAWNIIRIGPEGRSSDPLLSVKLDARQGQVHVTRAILCYVQEGYHAGDNVYLSRETPKWVRELTATIPLARFQDGEEFRDELVGRLFQAVVGLSRLPLTSVEAPLPDFTLGELGYFYQVTVSDSPAPRRSFRDLIEVAGQPELCWLEQVKLLELILRATPLEYLDEAAIAWVERLTASGKKGDRTLVLGVPSPFCPDAVKQFQAAGTIAALLRGLFDEVALSPYTDFVPRTLMFLASLERQGAWSLEAHADFLSYLLRQLGRHLTAYDLVTFHHRGANYPDILLLDAALKQYLALIERQPALFHSSTREARVRRRALRQSWLLRRRYEGHPVPDAPTSPGENARILPPPHARVPEQQIVDPTRRARRLFVDDPLSAALQGAAEEVFRESLRDLEHPQELRELGMAIFLDRPFGVFKGRGEPDHTLLLSYETFSRRIAGQNLREIADRCAFFNPAELAALQQRLADLQVGGVSVDQPMPRTRPRSVALTDALRVADDFVVLRTTARSVREFRSLFDFTPLAERFNLHYLSDGRRALVMRAAAEGGLRIFDEHDRCRLELRIDPEAGYENRGGIEYPARGLQVVCVREPAGDQMMEYRLEDVTLWPK